MAREVVSGKEKMFWQRKMSFLRMCNHGLALRWPWNLNLNSLHSPEMYQCKAIIQRAGICCEMFHVRNSMNIPKFQPGGIRTEIRLSSPLMVELP